MSRKIIIAIIVAVIIVISLSVFFSVPITIHRGEQTVSGIVGMTAYPCLGDECLSCLAVVIETPEATYYVTMDGKPVTSDIRVEGTETTVVGEVYTKSRGFTVYTFIEIET